MSERLAWWLAAGLLCVACDRIPATDADLGKVPAFVYAPAPDARVPEFVAALEDAVRRGDRSAIARLFDWQALTLRAFAGLPERIRARGIEREHFTDRFATLQRSGRRLKYVGIEQHEGLGWHTFRITEPTLGYEHVGFLLSLNGQGQVRAVDTWMLSLGESASSSIRRLVVASLEGEELAALLGVEAKLARNSEALRAIVRASAEERYQDAFKLVDALPAELSSQRWVAMMRAGFAAHLGQETYLPAIARLKATFPNDQATLYHDIAAARLTSRHADVLAAIDALERVSASHAYYDLERAIVHLEAGRPDEARAALDRAEKREPDLPPLAQLRATLEATEAEPSP